MSHTKGPWHLHRNTQTLGFRIDSEGNEWQGLAKVYQAPDLEEEGEANAHLIAAAPELLEELKVMANIYEHGYPPTPDGKERCLERVKKLISKAEGKLYDPA